ncbi:DUF3168 domain-containing protein [Bradyrhizobium sp. Leo170]|uniref:DUF3168 domain-containing protein n=1 Tax=Bradyrhizobium sp. Leo170 TaxID=1571199 RepID=UPI00102E9D0E|nr:DUF3168 domain-containing protein [Bradyrhizobium sp. Leo170]TAI63455.1 hypothetical protein CWO89_24100 [Bradyrhizobium sp. Leo170]
MTISDPSLELQKAIRSRLIASAELMALVPPDNVLDATGRPERMPCVLIGEGQSVLRRFDATSYATLHVWFQEPGLVQCKQAASAIVEALRVDAQISGVLHLDGWTCHDLAITQTRFMRDPHGSYSHGIVSVAGIMTARAA